MPTEDGKAKSCSSCSLASGNPLDRLATLGHQAQNNLLLPVKHSSFKGFPIVFVSSATGELSFATTDLAFKDNPLLLFQRTYDSSRIEDSGLGRGWSFAFNDSITFDNDNAVLTTSTGDKFTYRRAEGKSYVLQTPEAADVQGFEKENGNTISAKNGDVTKTYQRAGNTFYLSEITAPNGWEVSIKRNSDGKITKISGISGEINLNWSNGNNAKLLSVSDSAGRRVSFGQSNGLLQSATTATSGIWQYEYANGRLSRAVDPTNRIALRAKYDATGRAVESGDAIGANHFAYELNTNNISMLTTVTDSLNYVRVFQQNDRGILTQISDTEGIIANLQYNDSNNLVQLTDVNSATTKFEYDTQQRPKRQLLPNGDEKVFEYNATGKLSAAINNGERTEFVYDESGNQTKKIGKNSKTNFNRNQQKISQQFNDDSDVVFQNDDKGRITSATFSDIGRFERSYDAAGRKTSEKMPSGLTRGYEYNADNQIVRQSDNRGHSGRVERDASGNVMKLVNSNADSVQVIRDEAGRIVQLTNSRGQSRRYAYDSRGALTEFLGADGRDLEFQYNERGEMQSIVNAQSNNFLYRRNRGGSLAKLQQPIASQKNFWQMQKINFVGSTLTNATVNESCAFGDGFYSSGADSGWDFWGADDMFGGGFGGGNDMYMIDTSGCSSAFGGGGGGGGDNCYNRAICIIDAGICLAGVATTVFEFVTIAACPETLGATCILTLILHPFTSYGTGTACATAVRECQKPVCR